MWFSPKDIHPKETIVLKDIHGYVLPHAGTKYTGEIISHTLRFKPSKYFTHVLIVYSSSHEQPNINNKYYHEYYVVWKSIDYFIRHRWNIRHPIVFIDYNVRFKNEADFAQLYKSLNITRTLCVISADFSHYLPMAQAIELENCAAHCVIHKSFDNKCSNVIDTRRAFDIMNMLIPKQWEYQWIGRTRSPGKKAVGYLSFLMRDEYKPIAYKINGYFITVYSDDMEAHECLGKWTNNIKWSIAKERAFLKEVIRKGNSTSRLTRGLHKRPIKYWTITYLFGDNRHFIRGWHGIKHNAFYLPNVLLEHTFNNGKWFDSDKDTVWPPTDRFQMKDTLDKLNIKSNISSSNKNITLYNSSIKTGIV